MAVSPPSIVGVLSPISDSVRLQGQMTGSTIEVSLTDGHYHTILAIDPDMPGCPGNDPTQLACRRDELTVLGSDEGPVLYYAIDIGTLGT